MDVKGFCIRIRFTELIYTHVHDIVKLITVIIPELELDTGEGSVGECDGLSSSGSERPVDSGVGWEVRRGGCGRGMVRVWEGGCGGGTVRVWRGGSGGWMLEGVESAIEERGPWVSIKMLPGFFTSGLLS